MLDFLREEHVDEHIIKGIEDFRREHPSPSTGLTARPRYMYYGKEIWEQAAEALLCGENLLLAGSKATGKNVLAENLACLFGRPSYNVSFHINMDASFMIGTDTFRDGQVVFRPGPVCQCATLGGFCILDEINMARNEALAVLHSVLDFRRVINVPGYDAIPVHDAARFIATMNYGYAGTRDLNEALASRFMVIHMPEITRDNLEKLLRREFPDMKKQSAVQFSGLFTDIESPGSARSYGCHPPDSQRSVPSVSTRYGDHQQDFRRLRAVSRPRYYFFQDIEKRWQEYTVRLIRPNCYPKCIYKRKQDRDEQHRLRHFRPQAGIKYHMDSRRRIRF